MAAIVVVGDRPVDRKFLVTLLRAHGHVVREALDGADALSLVEGEPPDLVISDVLMPTLDGFEFVRRIREQPGLGKTPVLFYTATDHAQEALSLAQRCGVADVLTKPAESSVIMARIDALLAAGEQGSPPSTDSSSFARDRVRLVKSTLARTAGDLDRTRGRLTKLVEVAHDLAAERNPRSLLVRVCASAREVTLSQYAVLGLVGDRADVPPAIVASGLDEGRVRAMTPPSPAVPLLAEVLETRQPVRRRNVGGAPQHLGLPIDHPPAHSVLIVPIASTSRVYGWITVANKLGSDEFLGADEEVAVSLAAHAAVVYENVLLYEQARAHAEMLEGEVAERRRVEAALREAHERTEFALSAAGVGVGEWDLERDTLTWSNAMRAVFGREGLPDPRTREEFYALVHPDDRATLEVLRRQMLTGRNAAAVFRTTGSDGRGRLIDLHARKVDPGHGRPFYVLGVATDITARRSLEDQLRQAQKMEAIGQLAGGVAHDFNNMLTAILGYAQLIADTPDLPATVREDVELIADSGRRASALTRQLLTFSRKQVLQPVALDLNQLIRGTIPMLRRLIGEHIELSTTLDDRASVVWADPHQIEQILLNLSVNARDAMPNGGRLLIETADVELDDGYVAQHAQVTPGRYVMLALSDTGIGMDAETRARIFEPFFTTKPAGQGTGLGLATVDGIVKQSGGSIWVYSEPGQGTTFRVYLPPSGTAATTQEVRGTTAAVRGGGEVILVVEDEKAVRLLICAVLRRLGYTVIEAESPAHAEVQFQQHADAIVLVITDVAMPGLNGPALFARLATHKPSLKVLYASGYADGSIAQDGRLAAGVAFLQKPFTGEALGRKVREVLDT